MSPKTWFRLLGVSALLIVAGFAVPGLTQTPKGKKYALLVGVKSYEHRKLSDLKYTENDAEEMASVLKKGGYDEVIVLTTTRGDKDDKVKPTKANIERELKRLLKKVTKHDVVLIGLAGHGVQYEVKLDGKKRDESFFCPADAKLIDSDDFDKLAESMVPFRALFAQLDDSGAGSRLLLIDACRNDPGSSRNADTDAMPKPTKGTAALFACKGGERAHETDKLGRGHGIFFYHVIEGLKGKAKDEDGEVSWDQLTVYVRRQVTREVPKLVGGGARQTPHLLANVEGDPVLLRAGKDIVEGTKDKDKSAKEEVGEGPLNRDRRNTIDMKFALVKKGSFQMGSPRKEKDRDDDEDQHEVEITKDFYLGVSEVTQGQFRKVMGYNPSFFSNDAKGKPGEKYDYSQPGGGKDNVKDENTEEFPVENISYKEAQEFIDELNKKEVDRLGGWKYCLPTEAQWEYACRGGATSSTPFHFGDNLSVKFANYNNHLGRAWKAGESKRNGFGLYDTHGNVWEWCQDWYEKDYDTDKPNRDPSGPSKGTNRVYRGGSWRSDAGFCRTANRHRDVPSFRDYGLGFRVALIPAR